MNIQQLSSILKGIIQHTSRQTGRHLVSIRNHGMRVLLNLLQNEKAHHTWEIDLNKTSEPLHYKLYANPFNFRCRYFWNMSFMSPGKPPIQINLLPEWFVFLDDKDPGTFSAWLNADEFWFHDEERDTIVWTRNVDRYLEVRLCGKDDSPFKKRHPLGIDVTAFGNLLFSGIRIHEDGNQGSVVHLYMIFPFILYHALGKNDDGFVIPYEKDSLYMTLLDDDTFEVTERHWEDQV